MSGTPGRRLDWSLVSGVAAFVLSGFAALVYQVAWQRILALFSGVHTWSVTVIVTAFMVGLGFGSLLGGRVADRLAPRAAARAFAACELVVALFGAASPWLYYDLAYQHLGSLVRHAAVLPLVHFVLLVVPTLLMGASLPLLSRALVTAEGPSASRRIAWLYAANTLGAAAGAFATSWWLAGEVGFAGTIRLAAGLNVGAALLALGVTRRREGEEPRSADGNVEGRLDTPAVRRWALTYGLSGFIALGLEMVWLRALGTMIKSSPHTFGHLLGILLLALGLGGLAGAWLASRRTAADAGSVFLRLQWAASVSAALPFLAMPFIVSDGAPLGFLYRFLASDSPFEIKHIAPALAARSGDLLELAATLWVLVPTAVIAPSAFLMGASYAWIQRAVQTDVREVGRRVGLVQAGNVFGCALGSAATGLLFFEVLGTAGTLRLLVSLGGLFGLLLASRRRAAIRKRAALFVVALPLGLAVALPGQQGFWSHLHGADPTTIVIAEDASSVVSMHPYTGVEAVMRVGGVGHSVVPYGEIWALLGILPALVHGDAKHVLIIGMATGGTPWAAAKMPGVERVDLYEIARPEHEVLVAWEKRGPAHPEVLEFLGHPRIRTSFTDGRLALRLEPTLYDVIEADATEPFMAYSGNLYSLEFFREVRSRLAPEGLFCTYVPSRRVAATVLAAFPHVLDLRMGDTNIMIAAEGRVPFEIDHLISRLDAPDVRTAFDSTVRGAWLLEQVRRIVASVEIREIGPDTPRPPYDLNTDLFPRDEFDWRLGPTDSSLEH